MHNIYKSVQPAWYRAVWNHIYIKIILLEWHSPFYAFLKRKQCVNIVKTLLNWFFIYTYGMQRSIDGGFIFIQTQTQWLVHYNLMNSLTIICIKMGYQKYICIFHIPKKNPTRASWIIKFKSMSKTLANSLRVSFETHERVKERTKRKMNEAIEWISEALFWICFVVAMIQGQKTNKKCIEKLKKSYGFHNNELDFSAINSKWAQKWS